MTTPDIKILRFYVKTSSGRMLLQEHYFVDKSIQFISSYMRTFRQHRKRLIMCEEIIQIEPLR